MWNCEHEKKSVPEPAGSSGGGNPGKAGASADTLNTFHDRLRDGDALHSQILGRTRFQTAADQSQQAVALADEFGILRKPGLTCADWRISEPNLRCGTEHLADFSEKTDRWGKITIPPAFGLIPQLVPLPVVNLRHDPAVPAFRKSIEFLHATPLEYLGRWRAANEIFGDDVRLESVIVWADGRISFGISQPSYHGWSATPREIEAYF